ncbi:hypothetical protein AB4Z42_17080 [Mycobacterium sp. 2YAF39]|uniref:hypothetical protein n=1 Tax=Mycobacterium sp. 2YAF39 TaxID=3233033 RepID=UPI003F965A69
MKNILDLYEPFKGRHNPLRNGWSTDMVAVVAAKIDVSLPEAFIACSLVAEKLTTGMPLRYSRSQRNYSYFETYEADPMMTYRKVIPAVGQLMALGYAKGHKGLWDFKKQSILEATPKLMERIGWLVDLTKRQGAILKDEIVLRDKNGKNVGFTDTAAIRQMRIDMKTINAHLTDQQYLLDGVQMYIPPAARIFNQNFRRGGRLYCQGSSYQQMSPAKRANITMVVDGDVVPMVEEDFDSLHMRLVYQRAGRSMPTGDLYEVDGFSRKLAKKATLVSLNADGTEVNAITHILEKDEELADENGLCKLPKWEIKAAVERLIAAIKRKHYRVREFFGTGVGAQLMRIDSDIAVKIMLTMIEKTGRCPLVVHDSFIVPVSDAPLLRSLMADALALAHPSLTSPSPTPSEQGKASTSSSYIHMVKHLDNQGERVLVKTSMGSSSTHCGVGLAVLDGERPPEDVDTGRRAPDG